MIKFYKLLFLLVFTISLSQTLNTNLFEINYRNSLSAKNLFKFNDKILFAGDDSGNYNYELWVYDSILNKSSLVKEIFSGASSPFFSNDPIFTEFKNSVYFVVRNTSASRSELWVTDATTSGTQKIFDFPQSVTNIIELKSSDNKMVIGTNSGLFITDGTTSGTSAVSQTTGEILKGITNIDGNFIYASRNMSYTYDIWTTDGNGNTVQVQDIENGNYLRTSDTFQSNILNSKLFFYGSNNSGIKDGIWNFDSTTKKATYITDAKNFSNGIVLGNKLIYKAWDSQYGGQLWSTDGTKQNTIALSGKNNFVTAMNNQNFLMKVGNNVYFFLSPSYERNKLWKTDGTLNGTVSTNIVINDYAPDLFKNFPVNDKLMIKTNSGNLYFLMDSSETLTPLNNNFLDGAIEFGNKLVLPFSNAKYGNELFQYSFNTSSFDLLNDGNHKQGSDLKNFVISDQNQFIFTANDYEHGNEFYILNNSLPSLIKDNKDSYGNSSYGIPDGNIFKVGNYYYIQPISYNKDLAKTDGTEQNTTILSLTGNNYIDHYSYFGNLNDNSLIFTTYNSDNDRVIRVWKTDNVGNSINLIKEIPTGNLPNYTKTVTYNGFVYFIVESPTYKQEIWRTDGTTANTTLAVSITDEQYGSNIPSFVQVYDGKLLINKNYKLWSYDSITDLASQVVITTDQYIPSIVPANSTKEIDGNLYMLSPYNGMLYKFVNLQTLPIQVFSSNRMGTYSEFQKCGGLIYFATGNYEKKYNALWSIDPKDNTKSLIFMNDYSETNRINNLSCVNNYFYYFKENSNKLWRTDGKVSKTIAALDLVVDNSDQFVTGDIVDNLFSYNQTLYFTGTTTNSGKELYYVTSALPVLGIQSADTVKNNDLIIYPNPTKNIVNIYGKSKILKIELYDISGKKISEYQSTSINLNNYKSGIYILKIITENFVETKKIIKQ